MKTEDLKAQGLTDEQIKFIMAENGKDIEVEKAKISTEAEKLKTANETIKQLHDTVKKFDGVDVEQLKQDLADAETKYNTDIAKLKLEAALDMALLSNKAKSTKAVKAMLNLDEIKLDGEKLLGLDSQLEQLKTESDYLFDVKETKKDVTRLMSSGLDHQETLNTRLTGGKTAVDKINNKVAGLFTSD